MRCDTQHNDAEYKTMTSALAYYSLVLITAVKGSTVQAPGIEYNI